MWDFIVEHWPKGVFASAMGLAAWLGRREIKRNDDDHDDYDVRIKEVEKRHVSRDDFDELRSSMTASMVNLSERMENNMNRMHDQNSDTLNRIHTRVDDLWKTSHVGGVR